MSRQRDLKFAEQDKLLVQSYMYSMDSKSSESIRENGSAQSTLIDKIARNKIERSYSVKGEKGKSLLDSLLGKESEADREND